MRYYLWLAVWVVLGLLLLLLPKGGHTEPEHDVTTIVPRVLFHCGDMTGSGEGVILIARYKFTFTVDCGKPKAVA